MLDKKNILRIFLTTTAKKLLSPFSPEIQITVCLGVAGSYSIMSGVKEKAILGFPQKKCFQEKKNEAN
jgi:hypothetical protein